MDYISNMPNKPKVTVVEEDSNYGLYVWKKTDGTIFSDGDGNILNIPARKWDVLAMKRIREAAAYYGAGDGVASFMPGVMRVTDEEHSVQVDRMKSGLIASEFDVNAWADAAKGLKAHGED